jgi:hypothetical protein
VYHHRKKVEEACIYIPLHVRLDGNARSVYRTLQIPDIGVSNEGESVLTKVVPRFVFR